MKLVFSNLQNCDGKSLKVNVDVAKLAVPVSTCVSRVNPV